MSHNPNPFDFVPFAEEPTLNTIEKWMSFGETRTGRITVEMKALTPVHIVGEQPLEKINGREGKNIKESRFYQRNGKYFIPGSSIRGVLRGFIEAACNGWASQLTPYYEKEKEKHAIGFKVVDSETDSSIDIDLNLPSAINQKFTVPSSAEKGIDLATFLFGYIPSKPLEKNQFHPAWKSRIIIDDAEFNGSMLSSVEREDCPKVPDLHNQKAFMGGPHPRATSWWYQFPKEIRKDQYGAYKFIGSGFRGRKFYFHQNPANCINYYATTQKWQRNSKGEHKLYFFPLECLKQGESISFDLLFNGIPEELLSLLCFALEPGKNIRHKIGYGKAYGYGSVEFSIVKVEYKSKGLEELKEAAIDEIRASIGEQFKAFSRSKAEGFIQFLDRAALDKLSFILWYDEISKCIFTYPFAGTGGFNVDLNKHDRNEHNRQVKTAIEGALNSMKIKIPNIKTVSKVDPALEEIISRNASLLEHKPTLHFEVYQEQSNLDEDIKEQRKFNYD
ncbi:MAG: hypothetical protein HGA72_04685 [Chlorobiaceae bacterium]|nr:hypothetical protein [Chlorobiaceae bacterium]